MCDSLSLIASLDSMSDKEYSDYQYPYRNIDDTDNSWIEYKDIYCKSPLTGAGFKITPIGMPIQGSTKCALYGRIAAYRIEVNPPACIIGHNRLLVNGIYQGSIVALLLLKYWLAVNGCTKEGIERICIDNAILENITPTFLFLQEDAAAAHDVLRDLSGHAKVVMNKPSKIESNGKNPAFTIPKAPNENETYTLYMAKREFKGSAYVKEINQPNSFLLPLTDQNLELEIQQLAIRTVRVENKVHGKWLKSNNLDKPSDWINNASGYNLVLEALRHSLRLDENLRDYRLKKTTVDGLHLSSRDKAFLIWHLNGNNVLDHSTLRGISDDKKKMSIFYAARDNILKSVELDISIPYENQIRLIKSYLSDELSYQGEYIPPPHLSSFIFSRTSLPEANNKLKKFIDIALEKKTFTSPLQKDLLPRNISNRRGYGISAVPIYLDDLMDD